jgi:hypothetical protein
MCEYDPNRQAGELEIEITPAMINAGVVELREKRFGTSESEIVRDIYLMMEIERRADAYDAIVSACFTRLSR